MRGLLIILMAWTTAAVANDEVIDAELTVIERTVPLRLADCLETWDGYKCKVDTASSKLIGGEPGISSQSF